jgi:hypothetical protein
VSLHFSLVDPKRDPESLSTGFTAYLNSIKNILDPLEGASYGVLMAQQTGLTPCQGGPVPVHLQNQEERPLNGQLSELR